MPRKRIATRQLILDLLLHRSRAEWRESCEYCGIPFAKREKVWRDAHDNPFCSRGCAHLYMRWLATVKRVWEG